MSRSIDITNRRFGRLTAIKRVEDYIAPSGSHAERWEIHRRFKQPAKSNSDQKRAFKRIKSVQVQSES